MQLIPEYREDVERVERFNLLARFSHWGHTVTYLICLVTGLLIFLHVGGSTVSAWIHRISAVGLTFVLIIGLVFGFNGLIAWIKDLLRFGMNDIGFLTKFPLEFLGFHVNIPPQTRFNGGEKGNSIVTPTAVIFLALSGYIMWFPSIFPGGLVRASYWIHDLSMIIGTCMVCMHAYLGSFHPGSGESFWGMWKGTVRADWAQHHHAIWYEETYGKKADAE
ncbi:MAG: cytochrome b/b6 domain-containing protein [Syntrophomonas sp.]